MILPRVDPNTGLATVQEERATAVWSSLPRKPWGTLLPDYEKSGTWQPKSLEWGPQGLSRVRCIKCGVDLRSLRSALDRNGARIQLPNGQLLGGLLMLNHYRAKYWHVWQPAVQTTVRIAVLHCADCGLAAEDGDPVVACYLAALQLDYLHTKTVEGPGPDPHEWASHLVRWGKAESIGPEPRPASAPHWRS